MCLCFVLVMQGVGWLNYEVPFCYFPFYISVYEILGGMIFMSIVPNYSTSFY